MNLRDSLLSFSLEKYSAEKDSPWEKYPQNTVLRHRITGKWFALFMLVPNNRLGIKGDNATEVVNLKCKPEISADLCREKGIMPAYHMNKHLWITVFLDGSVDEAKIKALIDLSYQLTVK